MSCRLCGARATPLADRGDVALYRCARCGFVSGQPAATHSAEARYADYHAGPAPPPPVARYEEWLGRAERTLGCGRLLEVGAGSGGFVSVALDRGWEVDATEVSRSGLAALRQTAARVFDGEVVAAGYDTGRFDLVVALEVLEHVPEPLPFLRELARVLRPGGLLLLTTPSFDGLSRRLFGARWRVVDPEHLGYFTPRSLARALRDAGFGSARVRSRSLDVTTWLRGGPGAPARFDPQASAQLRDRVQGSPALRLAKDALNALLGASGLGDSLLAWARR